MTIFHMILHIVFPCEISRTVWTLEAAVSLPVFVDHVAPQVLRLGEVDATNGTCTLGYISITAGGVHLKP